MEIHYIKYIYVIHPTEELEFRFKFNKKIKNKIKLQKCIEIFMIFHSIF